MTCSRIEATWKKANKTHEIVKSLLDSDFGVMVFDRLKVEYLPFVHIGWYIIELHLKGQLLPKAMTILKSKIDEGEDVLAAIESTWAMFFGQILPTLECMLYQIEVKYI